MGWKGEGRARTIRVVTQNISLGRWGGGTQLNSRAYEVRKLESRTRFVDILSWVGVRMTMKKLLDVFEIETNKKIDSENKTVDAK